MQKAPSQVASGNIAPAIAGPNKDMKDVYVLAGLVFVLAGVIGAFWLYSQNQPVSPINSKEQLNGTQVSTALKNATATGSISEPITRAVETSASAAIGDIVHSDIYFEVGRKDLTDEAKSMLQAQADILKKDADWGVLIQGYTDQQGPAGYNKKLGLKRAENVKEQLVALGVPAASIKVVSLGEEGVLCADSSDTCRQMNRRVHLELRKVGAAHLIPAAHELSSGTDSEKPGSQGRSAPSEILPSTDTTVPIADSVTQSKSTGEPAPIR